ncbi:MAG: thiamine-phosphate kinase [Bacteroidota bacterium]|nr:thiamine-phosphate kinase [Bacteroidota bacterium]
MLNRNLNALISGQTNYKRMKLSQIGEFGIIEKIIEPNFRKLLGENQFGIGDDCAIMELDKSLYQIVTTDLLIENTHFTRDKISAFDLGFKALAVNLSDIASMGGAPVATFLSVGFPADLEVSWVQEFMQGYRDLSEKESVPLLGGDTTKSSSQIVINVAVIGKVEKGKVKKRCAAKSGDIICSTNVLGDSAAGLRCLQNNIVDTEYAKHLIKRHNAPVPRVAEGKFLSQFKQVHAMMDISDGVFSDIKHILKASKVGAKIYCDRVPTSLYLKTACKENNWNKMAFSISGGEDYELLFTVEKEFFPLLKERFKQEFDRELFVFGEIIEGEQKVLYLDDEKEIDVESGFRHFG